MIKKGGRRVLRILVISVLIQGVAPAMAVEDTPGDGFQVTLVGSGSADEAVIWQRIQTVIPAGAAMVESATAVLSQGWESMSPAEQDLFRRFFDPSNTGTIDASFVSQVLANYQAIRRAFQKPLVVEFETDSAMCYLQRLYYTDLMRIHVCPYFLTETRTKRIARQFVHEMVHEALLVVDRPYYRPTSSAYAELSPRGPWTAQIPVIGRLFREIAHEDTLYHPDAYAWFAAEVSEGVEAADQATAGLPEADLQGTPAVVAGSEEPDMELLCVQRYQVQ
jgi:hypothetical protein